MLGGMLGGGCVFAAASAQQEQGRGYRRWSTWLQHSIVLFWDLGQQPRLLLLHGECTAGADLAAGAGAELMVIRANVYEQQYAASSPC